MDGTKGDELDNVLGVIDDSAWKTENNFNEMFIRKVKSKDRLKRTHNLFYVCCSRAKNNLIVLTLSNVTDQAWNKVTDWLGQAHKINKQALPYE